jgi:hypothetical protein
MLAADDLKATTGIYDASLGKQSNETSGIAIQRRNVQAQTSNFHFTDNLSTSIRFEGKILVDLIPKIYDAPRTARIIGEDGNQKLVKVNAPFTDPETGKTLLYRLDVGKYDVTVDVGPSYASKRQEAAASMLELSKAYPQIMQIAGDLLAKNMDWPGATEIAERLKKTVPPNLLGESDNKGPQQIPPELQAQMQQRDQLIEQLTAKLNESSETIKQKQLELESKERIEMAKLETQATIELAKLESTEGLKILAHQIAEIDQRTKLLGFDQPMERLPQEMDPQALGAPSAGMGEPGLDPTGGVPPEQPMEGPDVYPSN